MPGRVPCVNWLRTLYSGVVLQVLEFARKCLKKTSGGQVPPGPARENYSDLQTPYRPSCFSSGRGMDKLMTV
jgi:hypothetical protein